MKRRLLELFAVDLRALAVFRVALALLLLYDLADRARDLRAYYTDEGVLPAASAMVAFEATGRPSLHLLSGSAAFQVFLFAAAAVAALGLLAGFKARWACLVSWILLSSLQNRNWYVLQAGDLWLRLLLFWAMFLPLGKRSSIEPERAEVSFGTAGLLLQTFAVYFFSGLVKWKDPSWHDGTAVASSLVLGAYATPFGTWLASFPGFVRILTPLTLWFEILGPLLLFSPLRNTAAAAFAVFQAGLGTGLRLGLFPWIGIAAMIPFWRPPKRPADGPRVDRSPVQILALLALAFVLGWNVYYLFREEPPRGAVWAVGQFTGLAQGWPMFASPPTEDVWYVFPARLEGGKTVEALDGIPDLASGRRWLKYTSFLESRPEMGRDLAAYLCRRWNRRHGAGSRIVDITVVRLSGPPGQAAPTQAPLGAYACNPFSN